ncbi:MAG: hypothetical protein ACRCR1_00275 [Aeromonas sp.]
MHKIGILAILVIASMTAFHADAQAVFGRLASTPVQQFNQVIRQANHQQQVWVKDYRAVAMRFVGNSNTPSRIHARQLDNYLVLSVALDGAHSDMLYILTLYRNDDLWQMQEAEMGWRCQGEDSFTPVPCP